MKCSKCGNEVREGAQFCRVCGTKIVLSKPCFCRECGKKISDGSMFCPFRGAKLNLSDEEIAFAASQATNRAAQIHVKNNETASPKQQKKKTIYLVLIICAALFILSKVSGLFHQNETKPSDSIIATTDAPTKTASTTEAPTNVASTVHTPSSEEDTRSQIVSSSYNTVTVGLYQIHVPSYWQQEADYSFYRAYAETSEKVAMLEAHSEFDKDDPVNFEWLDTESERNEVIQSLFSGMKSTSTRDLKLIDTEIIETSEIKGVLWSYRGITLGIPFTGYYFMFPSVENNHWIALNCSFTDNTEYRYDNGFRELISSIKRIENEAPETAESPATEPATTEPVPTMPATTALEPTVPTTTVPEPTRGKISFHSSGSLETAKKGNSGVFAYKKSGAYTIYYIIDFDAGYVYRFTDSENSCMKVKIISGDLNDYVLITYHEGSSNWSEGLSFRWKNQPDTLLVQEESGHATPFAFADLDEALKLRNKLKMINY